MTRTISLGAATATVAATNRCEFAQVKLNSGGIDVTLNLSARECTRFAELLANAAVAMPKAKLP